MADDYGIGDLISQEKGTAARFNSDKPRWIFHPLRQIAYLMRVRENPTNVGRALASLTERLADFQEHGTHDTALDVLDEGINFLMATVNIDLNTALCEVIKVWEFGEKKYARFNWMKGMLWSEPINSAQRHVMQMYNGEEFDMDSGLHHAAHFICNAMMMVHYVDHFPEGNDLPVKWFTT